ncbi:MAG: hypothetical protein OXD33_13375 [Rhodobacteraceae bacterium]|nr:hypothetical protein [Paracoccaceae bacterium]
MPNVICLIGTAEIYARNWVKAGERWHIQTAIINIMTPCHGPTEMRHLQRVDVMMSGLRKVFRKIPDPMASRDINVIGCLMAATRCCG